MNAPPTHISVSIHNPYDSRDIVPNFHTVDGAWPRLGRPGNQASSEAGTAAAVAGLQFTPVCPTI